MDGEGNCNYIRSMPKRPKRSARVPATPAPVLTDEIDHRLVEMVRSSSELKSITLRLGMEQIAEAKRVAVESGVPYQTILRRWVAFGAAEAQQERRGAKAKKPTPRGRK